MINHMEFEPTRIQSARHLAAAAKGGGARDSEANSNSKIGRGDVRKRRRCVTILEAMSGKLWNLFMGMLKKIVLY